MKSQLTPYLSFKDNAREAMEFYKGIFGGKLDINTFAEFQSSGSSDEDNKVMHAMLETDNGITFMASDAPASMELQEGSRISMSLSGDNEEELRGYWDKLAEGGTISMPLDKAPWGDTFGMLVDKFGIHWMVDIGSPRQSNS